MAAQRPTLQDRKDFDKFSKYLVYKCIQVIVQSRLGERVHTKSRPFSTGADWFNLAIKDIHEVTSETKKTLSTQSQILPPSQFLCLEISLKTTDGDSLVLEKWLLSMEDQCDQSAKVSYTVYNRMGTLLKSLFCVTRTTPGYRLSRKQGPDTFVICYRVYMGDPQLDQLGDGYNTLKVGTVASPFGVISLGGAYRTKLLISPQTISRDLSVELKDDHFNSTDSSPKQNLPKPCQAGYNRDRRPSCDSTVSESEMCAISYSNSPSHTNSDMSTPEHPASKPININRQPSDHRIHDTHSGAEKPALTLSQGQRVGAFAPQARAGHTAPAPGTDDIPFHSLLQHSNAADTSHNKTSDTSKTSTSSNMKSDNVDNDMDSASTDSKASSKSAQCHKSTHDDFVMVELKTPFAGTELQSDLGRFYRDCQAAPPLSLCEPDTNIESALNEISDQLAVFESNLEDIDSFVDSVISIEDST